MTTLRLIWTHAHGRDRWMRVLMCVIAVLVLMAVPAQQAGAAAQFTLWPAQFAYGTPSGDFTWNSTMFGLRFDEPLDGDRKSTRLNSSHVSISYAVFCLKKKKQQEEKQN